MFTGWKDVLNFTFIQNTKTKTFKTSLIGIAALIFIIFFGANVIMGYMSDKGDKKKLMLSIEQIIYGLLTRLKLITNY